MIERCNQCLYRPSAWPSDPSGAMRWDSSSKTCDSICLVIARAPGSFNPLVPWLVCLGVRLGRHTSFDGGGHGANNRDAHSGATGY